MTATECPPGLMSTPVSQRAEVLICVIGTADVMRAREDDLSALAADRRVHRIDWRLVKVN